MKCVKCHEGINGTCPYSHISGEQLTMRCPLLRESFLSEVLNLVTLHKPGERLPSSHFPEWLFQTKGMDYSRNDIKEIVNNMRPFNN